ncbi:unnamed protein product [Didymodactylos carnosus]|uniref:Uncharacterized protein n=1 Tax=Didymodactylos carnosus TaxID=1234261 RepID=A0A813S8C8_9BILA|nr:unnamed protein product [Didymodactylos carnosus]CAF1113237.1 unnamed protein product [Didymodactylos carnosus]CAF3575793.1 unnamed protein product [Didymodactylos carnosus]CAF3881863.1 unnamed protein product [Didymodactylos carnosus]
MNISNVAHSLLSEELDLNNINNNNNTSNGFSDLSYDDEVTNTVKNYKVYDTTLFDVLKVDPEDFASQITLLDLPVFKAITPDEMTSCGWNSKAKLEKAYHIVQFTRRFNQVNFWVQGELLRADILKNRTEILSHFIRIAKKLFHQNNNINGCMAVVMALQSAPIYRLQKTWAGLSKRDRTTFSYLKEFVSSNENWKKLRHHLSNTKLPCIPYLGIFLTDIIRIDTLHPHSGGLETSQRKNAMNNICRMISEFQQSNYDFLKPLDYVQNYLLSVRYMEELQTFIEDSNFKQSIVLEPEFIDINDHYTTEKSLKNLEKSASLKVSIENNSNQNTCHRRTLSDYKDTMHLTLSSKSATLPCRMHEKKSLLDDSVLSDCVTEETRSSSDSNDSCEQAIKKAKAAIKLSKQHHHHTTALSISLSSLSMKEPLNPLNDILIQNNFNFEGCLQRKCLLKNYKKPTLTTWHKYWVAICEHLLFFYKPKRFTLHTRIKNHRLNKNSNNNEIETMTTNLTDSDRKLFRQNPHKCQSISDWLIVLIQAKNRNEIQLSDLNKGTMYKFRVENSSVANIWYHRLKESASHKQRTKPENLIALD